jgi:hypothetical protein
MLIFALKADGLRSSVAATALRTASSFSGVLLHPTQLQSWQNVREAKHSQYLHAILFAHERPRETTVNREP